MQNSRAPDLAGGRAGNGPVHTELDELGSKLEGRARKSAHKVDCRLVGKKPRPQASRATVDRGSAGAGQSCSTNYAL